MHMADEVNVGRQVREDALTSVGAVTGDDDLIVGEPLGHHDDEFRPRLAASPGWKRWARSRPRRAQRALCQCLRRPPSRPFRTAARPGPTRTRPARWTRR